MTAEGNLYNPAVFEDHYPLTWDIVEEYMTICRNEVSSTSLTAIRGHLFKLYRPALSSIPEHRTLLGEAKSFQEITQIVTDINDILRARYNEAPDSLYRQPPRNHSSSGPSSPEWFCRSYIRDLTLFSQTYNFPAIQLLGCPEVAAPPNSAKLVKV